VIKLRTLGSLELRDAHDRDLCAKLQPKRLALLLYLAHAPRRFHRRDSLMALFWPELDPEGARNSLRQSLYELRRTLGKGVLTGRGYEDIAVAGDFVESDVTAFEVALASDHAERALELYRGDLLEGFHVQNAAPGFEFWLESERVRLRGEAVRAALELADREEARNKLARAAHWTREAARFDPDDESIVRKLIDLLDQAGDRAGAVRAYDAFKRRASEEYALEPAEETRTLIEAVRARGERPERPIESDLGVLEPPTTFIGRERELAALEALLIGSETRLVTLTGLGGSGKTRLALQLARRLEERFTDGAAVVSLGDVEASHGMLSAIVHGLRLREDGREGPREALRRYLAERELLLVLDGFERVRAAASEVGRLITTAPRLKILVTSQRPLKLSGEREYPIPALSLPRSALSTTIEFPLNSEAVALFVDRARGVRPDFRLTAKNAKEVVVICRRLDGLPLAIELAAARVKALTPRALAERLGQRFDLLKGGPADRPPRHRSLEAAIDWSHDLLDESEQALFRRLGVFGGGFGLELAEPLFEASGIPTLELLDGLAALVDSSLLRQVEIAGDPRFEMLDSVRAYARKLLAESDEEDVWRRRYARQVVKWVEEGERHYCTPQQDSWFQCLEREHENVRSALRWAVEQREAAVGVRLGAGLWPFWSLSGHLTQARSWLEAILAIKGRAPRIARAKALLGASWTASMAAAHERAAGYAKESARLYRAARDSAGHLRALETLGFLELEAGNIERAESTFRQCLGRSRALRDERRQGIAFEALGQVALARGDDLRAESLFGESISLARRIEDTTAVGHALLRLGDVARRSGAFDRATQLYEEALSIYRKAGQKINIGWSLSCLGRALAESGRMGDARESYAEALAIFQKLEYVRGTARTLTGFAAIALARGDGERAAALLGGAEALLEHAGDAFSADDSAAFEALRTSTEERIRGARFTANWTEGRALGGPALAALVLESEPAIARRALG
jgi:predicted ATPase/DNA-binding SARP family transcriptional activator